MATDEPVLVVGGAGFIGTNLADRLASTGARVRVLDNFSRDGSAINASWLADRHGDRIEFQIGDLRERSCVRRAVEGVAAVYHLAAQVAVTSSVVDPLYDFDVNLRGTLELLEAIRRRDPVPLIFTSTNKVYGDLRGLEVEESERRWEPADPEVRERGVSERQPLAFRSPYGCSKGAADQYVLDYAGTFGIPTATLRMSCIYGPHQFGTEDQGWVAHFLIRAIDREVITLYGDGKQVRDVLYVDDLVDALIAARDAIGRLSGRAFNIGGTPKHSVSLLELLGEIELIRGELPRVRHASWRVGDQLYYASDVSAFSRETGWTPRVGISEGIRRLYDWLLESRAPIAASPPAAAREVRGG